MQNPMQMIKQFIDFKNSFTGDPKAEVMKMIQSGKISQAQLNDLQRMASEFQNTMNQLRL